MLYKTASRPITTKDYPIQYAFTGSSRGEETDISEVSDRLFFVSMSQELLKKLLSYRSLLPAFEIDFSAVRPYFEPMTSSSLIEGFCEEIPLEETLEYDVIVQMPPRNRYAAKTSLRLRRRLDGDEFLRRTYHLSIAEIERILQARAKNYQIVGYVWEDQETEDWEENVVEVKTEFQDFEEKEDLWDVLGSILENTQQGVAKTYGREIIEDKRPFILHLSKM